MEVQEFQKRLTQISGMGKENGNQLDAKAVWEYFQDARLDQGQLIKVIQYLRLQGITVTEDPDLEAEYPQEKKKVLLLSEEEQAWWTDYQESLQAMPLSEKTTGELFLQLAEGDPIAQTELVQHYLQKAGELAVEQNCEEIHISDLIQEANVSLMTALSEPEPALKTETWLLSAIRKGIRDAIEEQLRSKYGEDVLVEKVRKLEQAIRDLNEDEENPNAEKFTAAEISVILDIPLEELKATLRLTGDDKA